jgi:hypothetical protein
MTIGVSDLKADQRSHIRIAERIADADALCDAITEL